MAKKAVNSRTVAIGAMMAIWGVSTLFNPVEAWLVRLMAGGVMALGGWLAYAAIFKREEEDPAPEKVSE